MSDEPFKSETVLDDDYPVHIGYLYVCDGRVTESQVGGAVKDLKRVGRFSEVRRCDIYKRLEVYGVTLDI